MNLHRFVASDAASAVRQIQAQLGPEAVVAHVHPVRPRGLSRLWSGSRLEVLAYVPEPEAPSAEPEPEFASNEMAALCGESALTAHAPPGRVGDLRTLEHTRHDDATGPDLLTSLGLLPIYAEQLCQRAAELQGIAHGVQLKLQMEVARRCLMSCWRPLLEDPTRETTATDIFIGPAGSGKTTVLCKWLTQAVLSKGQAAAVYRLDGPGTNTAAHLSLFCDMLGVQVQRSWSEANQPSCNRVFIDLPGVSHLNERALLDLRSRLMDFAQPRVHLCVNAAYSAGLILEIVRAYSILPVSDLIFTHLDEERSWGKLWNAVVGTSYPIRFLSSGQNIPGELLSASPEHLLRSFPLRNSTLAA